MDGFLKLSTSLTASTRGHCYNIIYCCPFCTPIHKWGVRVKEIQPFGLTLPSRVGYFVVFFCSFLWPDVESKTVFQNQKWLKCLRLPQIFRGLSPIVLASTSAGSASCFPLSHFFHSEEPKRCRQQTCNPLWPIMSHSVPFPALLWASFLPHFLCRSSIPLFARCCSFSPLMISSTTSPHTAAWKVCCRRLFAREKRPITMCCLHAATSHSHCRRSL